MEIENPVIVVKRAQAAERRAKTEQQRLNDEAIGLRKEIKKLKRLLQGAYDLIPDRIDGKYDKLIEEIDDILHRD